MVTHTDRRVDALLAGSPFENVAQLAAKADVSRGVMSEMLNNNRVPQRKTRLKLARALNIDEREVLRRLLA